ncbi:MAG: hypothetical protein ACTHJ8_08350 [Mucilaginibacter sp.]
MIFNEAIQKVISNLGWVDKGNLWVYDGIKADIEIIKLSESQYLTLTEGKDGYFSVVHHYNTSKIEITVHHFNNPHKEYYKTSFDNFKVTSSGDISFLKFVPRYYIGGLHLNAKFGFHLLRILDGIISLEDSKIKWYTEGDFDFGYQGLTSVIEINDELIFSVQRDGSLYRYSLNQNTFIEKVGLAGRYGNPQPITKNNEIWVADYDTIVKLKNWKIERVKKLQKASEHTSQFVGSISFDLKKDICIVARPFNGDVIGINKNLEVKYTCNIGKQPLEAVLMNNNIVLARDWHTGTLLKGKMKRKWFNFT